MAKKDEKAYGNSEYESLVLMMDDHPILKKRVLEKIREHRVLSTTTIFDEVKKHKDETKRTPKKKEKL